MEPKVKWKKVAAALVALTVVCGNFTYAPAQVYRFAVSAAETSDTEIAESL